MGIWDRRFKWGLRPETTTFAVARALISGGMSLASRLPARRAAGVDPAPRSRVVFG